MKSFIWIRGSIKIIETGRMNYGLELIKEITMIFKLVERGDTRELCFEAVVNVMQITFLTAGL